MEMLGLDFNILFAVRPTVSMPSCCCLLLLPLLWLGLVGVSLMSLPAVGCSEAASSHHAAG
jgi:hypothetical protein